MPNGHPWQPGSANQCASGQWCASARTLRTLRTSDIGSSVKRKKLHSRTFHPPVARDSRATLDDPWMDHWQSSVQQAGRLVRDDNTIM
eukprot:scaffold15635_cov105-Isochrysis_galbana.AAC.2